MKIHQHRKGGEANSHAGLGQKQHVGKKKTGENSKRREINISPTQRKRLKRRGERKMGFASIQRRRRSHLVRRENGRKSETGGLASGMASKP